MIHDSEWSPTKQNQKQMELPANDSTSSKERTCNISLINKEAHLEHRNKKGEGGNCKYNQKNGYKLQGILPCPYMFGRKCMASDENIALAYGMVG